MRKMREKKRRKWKARELGSERAGEGKRRMYCKDGA